MNGAKSKYHELAYLKVLKCGGSVLALEAGDFGTDVAAKDLPQRVRLFAARVQLGAPDTLEVRLLHGFHKVAHELVGVLLPPMHHMLADHLESTVDEHWLHHIAVLVAGRLKRFPHETYKASLAAILTSLARLSASEPVGKRRNMEQSLKRVLRVK